MACQDWRPILTFYQSTQSSFLNPQFFDEYAVRKLLCAVIETAVDDYNLCRSRGFIVLGEVPGHITLKKQLPKTLENLSEIKSLLSFFFGGGIETLIDAGNLMDETGKPLSSSFIRKALI